MNLTTKIIISLVLLSLIGGGIYFQQRPNLATKYFAKSVSTYLEGKQQGDASKYQTALKLADKSFKISPADTTQNLFYAQLLVALDRKQEALDLLNDIKATDSSAVEAVNLLIKELKL